MFINLGNVKIVISTKETFSFKLIAIISCLKKSQNRYVMSLETKEYQALLVKTETEWKIMFIYHDEVGRAYPRLSKNMFNGKLPS